jgi:hypothetical protein
MTTSPGPGEARPAEHPARARARVVLVANLTCAVPHDHHDDSASAHGTEVTSLHVPREQTRLALLHRWLECAIIVRATSLPVDVCLVLRTALRGSFFRSELETTVPSESLWFKLARHHEAAADIQTLSRNSTVHPASAVISGRGGMRRARCHCGTASDIRRKKRYGRQTRMLQRCTRDAGPEKLQGLARVGPRSNRRS